MSFTRRNVAVTITAGFAGVLAAPVVVWACTSQAAWFGVTEPTSNLAQGVPGQQVTASGTGFPAGHQVNVHWNSATGPVLASTTKTDFFSIPITIPADAPPGPFYVVATEDQEPGQKAAPLRVMAAEARGSQQPPSGPPVQTLGASTLSGPAAASSGSNPQPGAIGSASAGGVKTAAPLARSVGQSRSGLIQTTQSSGAGQANGNPGSPVGSTQNSVAGVPPDSVSSGDLWSGFGPQRGGRLSLGTSASSSSSRTQLVGGIGLVLLSIVALGGLALGQRRKVAIDAVPSR